MAFLITLSLLAVSQASLFTRQSCQEQSCIIAALSGSSGQPYDAETEPVFPEQGKECCIIAYNPSVADRLYQQVPGLQASCVGAQILQSIPFGGLVTCRPKTLLFAAGTNEDRTGGGPLGQSLQTEFDAIAPEQWHVQTLDYPNTVEGILCLAIPGGIGGRETIAAYLEQCPDTQVYAAGYSQGAMAARNAVANSTYGGTVKAVLTFGDPFNGASIKGYSGPVRTYCNDGDLVCNGLPTIRPPHSDYQKFVGEAAAYLEEIAGSGSSLTSSTATTTAQSSITEVESSTSLQTSTGSVSSSTSTRRSSTSTLLTKSAASSTSTFDSSEPGSSSTSTSTSLVTSTPTTSTPSETIETTTGDNAAAPTAIGYVVGLVGLAVAAGF